MVTFHDKYIIVGPIKVKLQRQQNEKANIEIVKPGNRNRDPRHR